ncbi:MULTISPECIES: methylamine utilization protein [Pseudomonas]|uniref:Methylamine utilization protein n=1 Tax=Pseudomonas neustonica TaxID=2487346 RepID=A0ABX9XR55_9PSED|nr:MULTISPECIES: methylamine utilization protein [Pseudomonas]MBA6419266.1 methylamine utilization protein [Pseudomonas sp. 5Ae-yellow]ROZ86897.1 methylamine utilization protein [Pseudomonas sp. SSM44]ROZ88487.1 methylamine utilization protein [Pseudomonas neustonica]|tara:strand:- start:616 stop:1305 length:690 start_codon:yes stop_codon:yes gene_type:complete
MSEKSMPHFFSRSQMQVPLFMGMASLASLFWSACGFAAQVMLTDEAGEPLANAVLMVDEVPALASHSYVMDQIDRQFEPHVLVVPSGSLVDFPNSDDVRHHVYSFSSAKPFELGLFKGSDAPPVSFERPGVVVLGCNIHDAMVGYILITDSPRFAVSDTQGMVSLADLPAGKWPVAWWHPSLFEQAPVALGELDLSQASQIISLPVTQAGSVVKPALSPLQQRFKNATQ